MILYKIFVDLLSFLSREGTIGNMHFLDLEGKKQNLPKTFHLGNDWMCNLTNILFYLYFVQNITLISNTA